MSTLSTDTTTETTMKIKSDATIGSQITRARTLLEKGKLNKTFVVQGIGTKAGTISIIVGQNMGVVVDLDVQPYTTPQGHRSLQVTVKVDTRCKPTSDNLEADKYWNVCVPDPDRNQSMASSCRALDGKLSDLVPDETIVLRGAGQALNVMVVFYSYIKSEWPGCQIVKTQFKNNVITNRESGRKNKKTLMSFIVKRNYWEEEEIEKEDEEEESGEEEEEEEESEVVRV